MWRRVLTPIDQVLNNAALDAMINNAFNIIGAFFQQRVARNVVQRGEWIPTLKVCGCASYRFV